MNKLFASLTLVGALLVPAVSHATPLYGTFGINLRGVTVTPETTGGQATPLDPVTGVSAINFTSGVVFSGQNASTPLFPDPTTGTISGSMVLYPNGANGGSGSPFTLTFGDYGTFVETANPTLLTQSVDPSDQSSTLALKLTGIFTPGIYFDGYTGGASAIVFTFNQNTANGDSSYTGSGTFSINGTSTGTTVANAPEPSSLILLGTGLLGAVGTLRRRMATV